jgi:hypothetical protein
MGDGDAVAALVVLTGLEARDVRGFAQRLSQAARALAVDDADILSSPGKGTLLRVVVEGYYQALVS